MSDLTVLNVKIDRELKRQAQAVAKDLGLPVSTLVSASLKDIVRRRSITISDDDLSLRPEVEEELLRISAEVRQGINVSPTFNNIDDALAWLHEGIDDEA